MASTASADGTRIDFDGDGAGDPPLVFVHGWTCNRSFFEPQATHFAKAHRVASIDLRGHGSSSQPAGPYVIEDFVADIAAVAAAEGMDRPVVIGHSMGALAALAAGSAGVARAVVMVDPAPLVDPLKALVAGMFAQFESDASGEARERFASGMFLPTDDPQRKAEIVAAMVATPLPTALAAGASIGTFDGEAALRSCAVPIACIEAATPTNPERALRDLCRHLVVSRTLGSGHFNQLLVPDQVNQMIEKFLEISL